MRRSFRTRAILGFVLLGAVFLSLEGCGRGEHEFKDCYRACAVDASPEDWSDGFRRSPGAEAQQVCDAKQGGPECPCVEACKASACNYASTKEMQTSGGGLYIILVLVLLVLLGSPLYVIIGGVTTTCLLVMPIHETMFCGVDEFAKNFPFIDAMTKLAEEQSLLAIPFFMVAGAIMSGGDIAKRLVAVANALLGALPGGLGLTTIGACVVFAAISGSSPVTVITIGAIMLPALAKAGYDEKLGLGLVTSAGSLGIVIPPSIPMIIFAIFATQALPDGAEAVTVDALFIAGIVPGLLIATGLGVYVMWKCRSAERRPFSWKALREAIADGIWALFLPFFILGGIYGSLFNATEAAAISVVLALVIELLIHQSLKPSDIPRILSESSVLMGAILLIICVAFGLTWFLTEHKVPEDIVKWLQGQGLTSFEFVLLLNLLLIIVGCLMDIISAIILFVPLIVPIACGPAGLGFDPVHLALIFIVNLEIGYLTPPLGLNLFVASTYFNKSFGLVMRSTVPFLLILVASLAIVTYVPSVSKGILNLKDGYRVTQRLDPNAPEATGLAKINLYEANLEPAVEGNDLEVSLLQGRSEGDMVAIILIGHNAEGGPAQLVRHWSDEVSQSHALAPELKSVHRLRVMSSGPAPKLQLGGREIQWQDDALGQAFAYRLDSPKDEVHLPTKTQGPALHGLDLAPELEAAGDKVPGSYLAIVVGPSATGVEITEPLTWGENDTNSRTTKRVVGLNTIFFLVEGKVVPSFMIDYRLFEFWQPFPNNVLVPSDEALDGDGESDKTTEDLSDLMDGGEGSDAPKKEFKKAQSTKALMQTKEYQDKLRELLGEDGFEDDEDEDEDLDDLPPLNEEEVTAPGKGAGSAGSDTGSPDATEGRGD